MAKYKELSKLLEHLFDASQEALLKSKSDVMLMYGRLAIFLVKEWEFKSIRELLNFIKPLTIETVRKAVKSNKKAFSLLDERFEGNTESIAMLVMMAKHGIYLASEYATKDEPIGSKQLSIESHTSDAFSLVFDQSNTENKELVKEYTIEPKEIVLPLKKEVIEQLEIMGFQLRSGGRNHSKTHKQTILSADNYCANCGKPTINLCSIKKA